MRYYYNIITMDNIVTYDENYKKKRNRNKPKTIFEMIEDDWETFKTFTKEKRKYIFWIIVFFITISFVDVLSIGASWENACNGTLMKGGADGNVSSSIKTSALTSTSPSDVKKASNVSDSAKPKSGNAPNAKKASNVSDSSKPKSGSTKGDIKTGTKPTTPNAKGKINKKSRIGGSPTSMFLGNGVGVVKKAFMMFATILMIAGALSVPFLLIIVATYSILKMIANNFMML